MRGHEAVHPGKGWAKPECTEDPDSLIGDLVPLRRAVVRRESTWMIRRPAPAFWVLSARWGRGAGSGEGESRDRVAELLVVGFPRPVPGQAQVESAGGVHDPGGDGQQPGAQRRGGDGAPAGAGQGGAPAGLLHVHGQDRAGRSSTGAPPCSQPIASASRPATLTAVTPGNAGSAGGRSVTSSRRIGSGPSRSAAGPTRNPRRGRDGDLRSGAAAGDGGGCSAKTVGHRHGRRGPVARGVRARDLRGNQASTPLQRPAVRAGCRRRARRACRSVRRAPIRPRPPHVPRVAVARARHVGPSASPPSQLHLAPKPAAVAGS